MAEQKIVYSYHPDTHVFNGTVVAEQSPLDAPGTYLLPSNSTERVPLAAEEGMLNVFNTATGYWSLVAEETVYPAEEPDPEVEDAPFEDRVNTERDARIARGFYFRGVQYQSGAEDRENISGASTLALSAIIAGAQEGDLRWHGQDSDFVWIAADNSLHPMDAQTMLRFGQCALAQKQAHIFAGRDIKNMDPAPEEYRDDSLWPDRMHDYDPLPVTETPEE